MIVDFTIEDLILNSYLQKNFHILMVGELRLLFWSVIKLFHWMLSRIFWTAYGLAYLI